MNISIDQVNVKDLGPISDFSHKLKRVNLIYGHNEKGKTCLVEFVIRSLFRNPKNWDLRDISGRGRVIVSGLAEKTVEFHPDSPKKIENYWEESQQIYPQDFSKLLVVRAAEVALSDNKNDVDTTILKNYLSGIGLLDKITEKIPSTIQNATIEQNRVAGQSRGDIKKFHEREFQLHQLNELKNNISQQLSEGELLGLRNQSVEFAEKISELEKAKRHLAFQINEKISDIDKNLSDFPEDLIASITSKNNNWEQLKNNIRDEKALLADVQNKSENYDWLIKAKELYEQRQAQSLPKIQSLIPLLGVVFFLFALFSFFFLENVIVTILSFCLSVALIAYYIYALNSLLRKKIDHDDIRDIREGFQEKFNQKFFGLTSLNEKIKEIEPDHYQKIMLKDALNDKRRQVRELETEIMTLFRPFYRGEINPNQFAEKLEQIKTELKNLNREKISLDRDLAALQVEPEDYLSDTPVVVWDKRTHELILEKKMEIDRSIADLEGDFQNLKQSARDIAGTSMSDEWESILWRIEEEIDAAKRELNALVSKCMAQIIISNIARNLQSSEEEKIRKGLQSSEVINSICKITNKYVNVDFQDGYLIFDDGYAKYPLNALSTGTIEQIFLSLRIGFASQAAHQNNLFLILDDAFQYSDWDRRPRLVNLVFELAINGWQIIYFSMDDHIRDLFVEVAGKKNVKDFSLIQI